MTTANDKIPTLTKSEEASFRAALRAALLEQLCQQGTITPSQLATLLPSSDGQSA